MVQRGTTRRWARAASQNGVVNTSGVSEISSAGGSLANGSSVFVGVVMSWPFVTA